MHKLSNFEEFSAFFRKNNPFEVIERKQPNYFNSPLFFLVHLAQSFFFGFASEQKNLGGKICLK